MSILSRERAPAPASAAQALIAEARRRQRRRRSGIAIVLAAIVGGVAAFAGLGGGGGASGPARARYASGGQVRAFLAAAERPVGGTFSVSYAVTAGHGASTYHADITAGQKSGDLFFYRETPALPGPGSPVPSASYEVVSSSRTGLAQPGPGGQAGAAPGLYSCVRPAASSPWSCTGPYTGAGMGTTGALTGPYPPRALLLGLQNAVEDYTGEPAPPAVHPHRAFLFTRRLAGRVLKCLGFGSHSHPLGTVCLEPDGLIASYDLPEAASFSEFRTATLRSYAPAAARASFALPAVPHHTG